MTSARDLRRVHAWLAKRRGLYAHADVVNALARCGTLPALELAASVLSVPGWRCIDGESFENHTYRLELNADCGGHVVQLLFSARHGNSKFAVDVVSETAAEHRERSDDARARAIRESAGKYLRLRVGMMQKATRWLVQSLEEELKHRIDPTATPPLVSRATTGDMDWSDVPPPVRETRLPAWLEVHRMSVREELYPVLGACETTGEMRFLTPILQAIDWRTVGKNRLITPNIGLTVQQSFEGGRFDFVIAGRRDLFPTSFAIEVRRPSRREAEDSIPSVRRAAHSVRYQLEEIETSDAANRGAWWADLLAKADGDDATGEIRDRGQPRSGDDPWMAQAAV